ncbi:MAG: hypothetical protein IKG83_03375 [Prevotella sp.]|nr:hypothetical protein [Prevotella sp.]
MYPVSPDYETIMAGARHIWYEGTITTVAGNVYEFDASNIVGGTGSINRRITDGTSLAIGSVTAAQFDIKLYWQNIDRYELYDAEINVTCYVAKPQSSYVHEKWSDASEYTWSGLSEYQWGQLQSVYEFPMGEFYVNEVTQDATTVSITAYDALLKFDASYVHTVANKTPYEWLAAWCSTCEVELGSTVEQIRNMPNGALAMTLDIDSVSDISTFRDALSYLCTVLCAVAVIGRDGRLYIVNYGTAPAKTFNQSQRYSSTLSDYVCYYTHLTAVYGETVDNYVDTSYSGEDDGITLDIDVNPFLQIADVNIRNAACQAILTKLATVHYAPYEVSLPVRPELDIMDVIGFIGGQADEQDFGAIMDITYKLDSPMEISCAGDNPKTIKENKYVKTIKNVSRIAKQNDDFAGLLANAYGMYRTEIEDPINEGAYAYALHNESTYNTSTFAMLLDADGLFVLTRDTIYDDWTISSASASDGAAFVETLTANMAVIDAIFSRDVTVSGALHSEDYIPAATGASPPYAQQGMGLDFGEKEFEGENFAIDANGKLYANGAEFTGAEITGGRITLTDAGGSNPNLRIYKETDPDNYGTVIGSTSWLKEWYDPNDTAHWYYYAWRFYNGEMTGGVADDVQRMSINWQKGTIEAAGNITSDFGDIYSGGNFEAEGYYTSTAAPAGLGGNQVQNFGAYAGSGCPSFRAKRTDSTGDVAFGIGSGGINHGMYSATLGRWVLYANDTDAYFQGRTKTQDTAGYTEDVYGNPQHQRSTNTDTWNIKNNAGASKFSVNYETGEVTMGTPLAISQGGTGATTRLAAFKNITNQNVGSSAQYFVTLTQNWASAGYSSKADVLTALNIKCPALWSGGLSTVNQQITFTWGGYNAYIIGGTAGGNYYTTVIIPANDLRTSQAKYLLSDEAVWVGFGIWYSGSTGYVKLLAKSGNGSIAHVWGIN